MREAINAYTILAEKREGEIELGRLGVDGRIILKCT
jgi:hypothetical protein